jgi:ubiquinone/menaquinone biosynthesis C-methylase UbiE
VKGRVKLAGDIATAIMKTVTLTPGMDVLDYGCGTGLLTLALRPHVKSITGVDSSQGMLDVLNVKIMENGFANITSLSRDLEKGDILEGQFHVITSSMTLHHVKNPAVLLSQFYRCLYPQGYLCIADLDPDGGKFHGQNDGVFHSGFERSLMRQLFLQAGFVMVRDITAATFTKKLPDEGDRSFSVFLMTGQR